MRNVIPIFDRRRPQSANGDDRRIAREVREIYNAIRANNMLRGDKQSEIVARNLGRLFEEAKAAAGVTRAEIAELLWGNKHSNPMKPLYKVTMPQISGPMSIEEQERKFAKHRKHLKRHTSAYVEVAEAIAAAVGDLPDWRREKVLVRLFRGTKIDQDVQARIAARTASLSDPADCWQELADRLRQLADWVSKEADLRGHLARIASLRGTYDLATGEIRPADQSCLLTHGPLHGNYEVMEEFPPIPSVLLFEELLADVASPEVTVTYPGGTSEAIAATARLWREYRLAIGPGETPLEPSALIEIRSRVSISSPGREIALRRPWIYTPGWNSEAVVDAQPAMVDIDLGETAPDGRDWRSLLAGQDFNGPGEHLQPEHCYAAWRIATAEVCKGLMGRGLSDGEFLVRFMPRGEPTLVPEGTVGSSVELAILAEAEPRLDAELLDEARRLVAIVNDYAVLRREQALVMHDRAVARWSASTQDAGDASPAPTES